MVGANFNWDEEVKNFSVDNLTYVDNILLGRNTADEIVTYWGGVANDPNNNDHEFGKLVTDIPKIVFSNKPETNKWNNTTIINGDIIEEINILKKKEGKNIMVYGGSSFVSSLIQNRLIDEFYLLVNPIAVGNGLTIFKSLKDNLPLTLQKCQPFTCGTVLLFYKTKK
ncbi:dihydrofolate reductase [Sinomicrobium pectinilyticum]|uniref:Dihydrofolate reductase n=1 Tax=Sinomicrobium pectinilyticum TaxID=1084421 RepID=A0A3N0ESL7_SINP1|nr:dihydrofolate reductase family protein [Sinomicrobium pectinilyticum]RNL90781.1 dihydrofolate reductase [Sinomicrobium pectinilyticum]